MHTLTLEGLERVGHVGCLDFVNTLNNWHDPTHDYLSDYPALLEWSVLGGFLPPTQAQELEQAATTQRRLAEDILKQAIYLRAVLKRVFSSLTDGQPSAQTDLEHLNTQYARAIAAAALTLQNPNFRFTLQWSNPNDLYTPLHIVAHQAGQLLTSSDLKKLKTCPSCGWVFLDTSKNGRRRWCSMNTCGSRDKMKRYYGRSKTQTLEH